MGPLHTIGYEGTTIDTLIGTLKDAGITLLADVRAVAISRKPGFSKKKLRDRLEAEGIRYAHFIDLGDPKPGREAARNGHLDAFRTIYGEHLLSKPARTALDAVIYLARNESVCLLCFERDPSICHRSIIASALGKVTGIEVLDLFGEREPSGAKSSSKGTGRYSSEGASAA